MIFWWFTEKSEFCLGEGEGVHEKPIANIEGGLGQFAGLKGRLGKKEGVVDLKGRLIR